MNFRSRKAQIESDFLPRIIESIGCNVSRKTRRIIKEELKAAAMVGAAEERWRTLKMIDQTSQLAHDIVKQPVLSVLGYEEVSPKKGK